MFRKIYEWTNRNALLTILLCFITYQGCLNLTVTTMSVSVPIPAFRQSQTPPSVVPLIPPKVIPTPEPEPTPTPEPEPEPTPFNITPQESELDKLSERLDEANKRMNEAYERMNEAFERMEHQYN